MPDKPQGGSVLDNERGATTVIFGVAILTLLGVLALSVDAGLLFNSKAEAQRAADAAALAGAAEGEAAAREVAVANGAELVSWRAEGLDVWVVVVLGVARGEAKARRDP
jgi:Flp pilus assembly protein TadG